MAGATPKLPEKSQAEIDAETQRDQELKKQEMEKAQNQALIKRRQYMGSGLAGNMTGVPSS